MLRASDDIEVCDELQAVRRRPAIYVGALSDPTIASRLLIEAFCIARDDAIAGRCTRVDIEVGPRGVATVRDDGPGLPVTLHQTGKPIAEVLLTTMYACRHSKRHTTRPETLCTVGVAALNALSSQMTLTVWRDGFRWSQSYAAGVATTPFSRHRRTSKHGTQMDFVLDSSILGRVEFLDDWLRTWLAANHGTLRFRVKDARSGKIYLVGAP